MRHLVRLCEIACREDRIFGWLKAVGGTFGDDNVHGHITYSIEFLRKNGLIPILLILALSPPHLKKNKNKNIEALKVKV